MASGSFQLHSGIETTATKDLILSILVTKWPLSARRIFIEVYNRKTVNYHTVFKALQELRARKILKKTEQGYQLNLAWLHNIKSFANVAEKYYYKKSDFFKLMQMTDEGTYAMTKHFKTMADLDDFILEFVEEERTSAYSISNHLWFPIFHPKRLIEHANKLASHGQKMNSIVAGQSPMDKYCADYLRGVGSSVTLGGQSARNIDFWVFGDKIVHAVYPDHIADKIDTIYTSTDKIEKIITPEFFKQTLFKKTTIPVVVVQSNAMADMLRKNIQDMLGSN